MTKYSWVYSIMVKYDWAVPMIEQLDQIMETLLNHDLIEEICDQESLKES